MKASLMKISKKKKRNKKQQQQQVTLALSPIQLITRKCLKFVINLLLHMYVLYYIYIYIYMCICV